MYIGIAGNIGAGKTTLVKNLAQYLNWIPFFESANDNPYLADFYRNMKRWAFPNQVYFLNSRFKQAISLQQQKNHVVMDRTIYEDAHIFAANLFQSGLLNKRDYENYLGLYHSMLTFVTPPSVLVYLKGSVTLLSERIKQRSTQERTYENKIPSDYLNNLNALYEQWIATFNECPVITVNLDRTDMLQQQEAFIRLTDKILQSIQTRNNL